MKDARNNTDEPIGLDELENYRRLVEIQSQIVDLARRNRETRRRCQQLRQRVTREALTLQFNGGKSGLRTRLERWIKASWMLGFPTFALRFWQGQGSFLRSRLRSSPPSNTSLSR